MEYGLPGRPGGFPTTLILSPFYIQHALFLSSILHFDIPPIDQGRWTAIPNINLAHAARFHGLFWAPNTKPPRDDPLFTSIKAHVTRVRIL